MREFAQRSYSRIKDSGYAMIVAVLVGCITERDGDSAMRPEDSAAQADSSQDTGSETLGELVATVEYVGAHAYDLVGTKIAVGAFGLEDRAIAVGTPSAEADDLSGVVTGVYVLAAPWSGGTVQSVASAGAPGPESSYNFGISVALPGDMSGDGVADLAVGSDGTIADGTGGFYILDGAAPADTIEGWEVAQVPSDEAFFVATSLERCGSFAGGTVSLCVDTTQYESSFDYYAWVFDAPMAGDMSVSDAAVQIGGDVGVVETEQGLRATDADGDGREDLLAGSNTVRLVPGLDPGSYTWNDVATATIEAKKLTDVGDLDGDGVVDFVIQRGDPDWNIAAVLRGPIAGELGANDATWTFEGMPGFGSGAAIGDFDADGVADFAIGASRGPDGTTDPQGLVYVYAGPVTAAAWNASDATRTLRTSDVADGLGWNLLAAELDGEAGDDLLVGAPLGDGVAENAGSLHLLFGGDILP